MIVARFVAGYFCGGGIERIFLSWDGRAMKTKYLLLSLCALWLFGSAARAQGLGTTPGAASHTSINNVIYADTQPGPTADVKINACIAALPANGGNCDGPGLRLPSQTISAKRTRG